METFSKDTITLLLILLPGFVAAKTKGAINVSAKTTELEKVVDALIYSTFAYGLFVFLSSRFNLQIDPFKASTLAWLFVLGVIVGFLSGITAEKKWIASILSSIGISKQTGDLNVLIASVQAHGSRCWSVIHFDDGTRLMGCIELVAAAQEDKLELFVAGNLKGKSPKWLYQDGTEGKIPGKGVYVSPHADIRFIEFIEGGK